MFIFIYFADIFCCNFHISNNIEIQYRCILCASYRITWETFHENYSIDEKQDWYFSILAYVKIIYVNRICIIFFFVIWIYYYFVNYSRIGEMSRYSFNLISIPFAQLSSGLISLIVVTNAQLEIWLFTWTVQCTDRRLYRSNMHPLS